MEVNLNNRNKSVFYSLHLTPLLTLAGGVHQISSFLYDPFYFLSHLSGTLLKMFYSSLSPCGHHTSLYQSSCSCHLLSFSFLCTSCIFSAHCPASPTLQCPPLPPPPSIPSCSSCFGPQSFILYSFSINGALQVCRSVDHVIVRARCQLALVCVYVKSFSTVVVRLVAITVCRCQHAGGEMTEKI